MLKDLSELADVKTMLFRTKYRDEFSEQAMRK